MALHIGEDLVRRLVACCFWRWHYYAHETPLIVEAIKRILSVHVCRIVEWPFNFGKRLRSWPGKTEMYVFGVECGSAVRPWAIGLGHDTSLLSQMPMMNNIGHGVKLNRTPIKALVESWEIAYIQRRMSHNNRGYRFTHISFLQNNYTLYVTLHFAVCILFKTIYHVLHAIHL